ncbi:Mu transposase domain-containing protein [Streptomyces coeruleorubidus]|uniref:Mu transposase domain-containing protein n=1 Tax=Streptomyces coeruleorubidus TaxID=116188 RepID=UPI0033B1EBF8
MSRARVENWRWTAFRSHYGIGSMYCRPGLEGAHEKGGVEGQIGWFRRNHLVPAPEVGSLAELNAMVERWDAEDDDRRIRSRPRTIGEYFAVERPVLRPLPDEPFETGRLFSLRVDRYAQIRVRTNRYWVPVKLLGRTVRVMLHASEVVVYDGRKEVARHERLIARAKPTWRWTTTLRPWPASPAPSPARPPWNRPAPQASSPPVHDGDVRRVLGPGRAAPGRSAAPDVPGLRHRLPDP